MNSVYIPEGYKPILDEYDTQRAIAYIKETCPDAKILWHMTWAYQADSTHGGFANYNNDQMKMYEEIVKTTNSQVLSKADIYAVIPSGTAIQNVRTSTVGDVLTRDGYHLSYGMGRYIAGLTWFAVLTGGSVDEPYYYPSNNEYKNDIETNYHIISECINNALEYPFEISQSQYYSGAIN